MDSRNVEYRPRGGYVLPDNTKSGVVCLGLIGQRNNYTGEWRTATLLRPVAAYGILLRANVNTARLNG